MTFTGSAATGQKLKTHRALVANSVRFTMEADSLNASILGPDAQTGTPEFDLPVKEVAREITAKAGQKGTAIRRVLVPADRAGAGIEALKARLAKVALGLPDQEGATMGALASLGQCEEVRSFVQELQKEAEIVIGNPDKVELVSGEAGKGAFLNPIALYCDKPSGAKTIHEVEAFGPVATVMPYDTIADAAALAVRGKGSRVAFCLATAFQQNRRRVMVLPWRDWCRAVRARAGGGEEMGGMRGVMHYMQRTAIQGAPGLLSAVAGRWVEGGPVRHEGHPFRKSLAELNIGGQIITARRKITLDDVEHFAHFTGDTFYAHMDREAAKANPFFKDRAAHGYLIVSFAAGLFVEAAPGPVLANYGVDTLRFLTPVYFGDSLQVRLTCKAINPRPASEYGEVAWDCQVTSQNGGLVAHYDALTMIAKHWPMS